MYDARIYDLVRDLLPDGESHQIMYLAQELQDAWENGLETMPCGRCGSFPCVCEQAVAE